MSSQTFKARVAFGSWINTPLMPAGLPTAILTESLKKSKGIGKLGSGKDKGKGKAKTSIPVDPATDTELDLSD
jgi:hypothetical protein